MFWYTGVNCRRYTYAETVKLWREETGAPVSLKPKIVGGSQVCASLALAAACLLPPAGSPTRVGRKFLGVLHGSWGSRQRPKMTLVSLRRGTPAATFSAGFSHACSHMTMCLVPLFEKSKS